MKYQLSQLMSSHRRGTIIALSAVLVGLTGAALHGAQKNESAPSHVAVQVDPAPVNRGTLEMASYSHVAKRVAPSVVKVTIETKARNVPGDEDNNPMLQDPMFRQFFGGRRPMMREPAQMGLGSGVIISKDGYIVTNNHVVESASVVTVTLDDGRQLKAKIVGRDPQTDVAVIKVEAKDLSAITFADSEKVEVGDRVLAIGNPLGVGESVTSGIVSAKGRHAGLGLDYEDFIQTDAAINPGNSGGALVDVDGRLIGINTAILSRSGGFQGIGLAVPSSMVRRVADSLVSTGKVVRGFLGVTVQDLTPELSDSFGLKVRSGALVTDVQANSPAAKAGVKSGDVITAINATEVNNASRLSLVVSEAPPSSTVDLAIVREGKTQTVKATVGAQPKKGRRGNMEEEDSLANEDKKADDDQGVLNGVAVSDIDAQTRREFSIPSRVRGAIITDVSADSPSARAGLKPGDVILELNHKSIRNAEEAIKLSEDASSKRTLLKLWSNGGTIYTVVDESGNESS